MSDLVVRLYNVRFGDAVLVMIPEKAGGHDVVRTILFDFGNALSKEGGVDSVLEPVIDDIKATLAGKQLDLYVLTHEHLDHAQGFFYSKKEFGKTIKAKQVWLTGSADPTYYDDNKHPGAKQEKKAAFAAYRAAMVRLNALPAVSFFTAVLMANNNPRSTFDCVKFLREELAKPEDVHFVDRTTDLSPLQPAKSAKLTLWAPEENTADYYGKFKPLAASLGFGDNVKFDDLDLGLKEPKDLELPQPPPGVDAGAFYNLLDVRHSNAASTLLNIDQAANNTSVVTLIEWKGWRLLFTGDAEKRSWRQMDKLGLVQPVHFLKVSHHGSHTGMPPEEILEKLLPMPASSAGKKRKSAVSTYPGNYDFVPHEDTLKELKKRTRLTSTLDEPTELFKEIRFPDTGPP